MWEVERSDDVIVFHVFTSPRTSEMKLAFYERLPQILEEKVQLHPDDVFVSLASNTREDWSFGNGKAQLLDAQNHATPEAIVVPVRNASSVGRSRAFSTLAGCGRALTSSLATHKVVGGAAGKLSLVAACGASAFIGSALALRFGSD